MKARFEIVLEPESGQDVNQRLAELRQRDCRYASHTIPLSQWVTRELKRAQERSNTLLGAELIVDAEARVIHILFREKEKAGKWDKELMKLRLTELKISRLLFYKLRFAQCETLKDVLDKGQRALTNQRGMGKKCMTELINKLDSLGVLHLLKP